MVAYTQFIADYDGKPNVSFDGIAANAGQCVQPVAYYARDYLHSPVMYANASVWFTGFDNSPLVGYFDKIANNPNDANQIPQQGAIIIWSATLPNSGGSGHIALYDSAFSGGFVSFDSNWGGKYCHKVSHNWSYVLGWLQPKQTNNGGQDMLIENSDGWRARANRSFNTMRGRNMGNGELDPWIGADFGHLVEALEDDPEADAQIAAANLGRLAQKDNWQGQIYGLQAQLKDSQDIANQLNLAVTAAQNANKADMQAALAKVADLTAKLQTANDKLVDIQKQQAADTETGNAFIRFIGRLFNSNK